MGTPKQILLVEDEAGHAELVRRSFGPHTDRYHLTAVTTLREAREVLAAKTPDLLIVDLGLPDGNGEELLPPEPESAPYPVIVMTSFGDEQVAVDAMKSGALDYLVKSDSTLADMHHIADRALREWRLILKGREAAQNLQLFRNLIDRSNDAIYVADPESGRFMDVNEQACRMLGYSRDELLELNAVDIEKVFIDQQSWEDQMAYLKQAGFIIAEGEHVHKDGKIVPVEVNTKLVHHEEEDYLVSVVRDITERKQAEARLAQAAKLAAVGELAAGVAHEINNPLANILNFAQLLKFDIPADTEQSDYVARIENNALRARKITRNLLTFARDHTDERKPSDLNEILKSSIKETHELVSQANIVVNSQLQNNAQEIVIDPNQIMQVAINLIKNAVDAMPNGGHIDIEYEQNPESDVQIITFKDNGTGIPESDLSQIFDPFFTTKGAGKGTGLGLAISYGIVKKHGGNIEVESEINVGTTFTVTLPLSDRHQT
ncbi:MAG: ATP-binding protein [Candidatus Neomarinimicrobiota bacterium]